MPSVPSIDRQKTATVLRSVEQSHIRDVLPVIEDRLRDALEGEEALPDVPFLATLLGRVQAAGTRAIIAADKAHEEELANDSEPRLRRDAAGERVHRKLVEVRRIAAGLFGRERSAEILGAPGLTAQVTEAERLWRQAEDTILRLEAPDFAAPAMTTASLQFDPAQLAAELRADNAAFREALDAVALERRKSESTLEVKNARFDESKRIDAACGRIYEGFFLLADRPDLLDRLRRALRRTRRGASGSGEASPEVEAGTPGEDQPPEGGESRVSESPSSDEPAEAG